MDVVTPPNNDDIEVELEDDETCNEVQMTAVCLTIIVAAFTWIVAVSWNKFMEAAFEEYYFYDISLVSSRFIYLIIITISAIIIIYLATLWLDK